MAHGSGQLVTAAAVGLGCLPIDCPAFHGGQRAGRSAGSVSAHPLAQGLVLEAPPQAPGGRQPSGGEQDSRPGGGRQQGALHPGPGGKGGRVVGSTSNCAYQGAGQAKSAGLLAAVASQAALIEPGEQPVILLETQNQ